MHTASTIRYLTEQDTNTASLHIDAVKLVRQAHADRLTWGAGACVSESLESPHRAGGLTRTRIGLAWLGAGNLGGASVICDRFGIGGTEPHFQGGMVLLIGGDRAQVIGAITLRFLRMLREAAGTVAVAQEFLRGGGSSVAILGALPVADLHLRLMAERLPGLTRVTVADPDLSRAAALCGRMAGPLRGRGITLRATHTGPEAVSGSDLVVSLSDCPRLAYDWLTEGTLVVLAAANSAGPDVVLRADRVFADDWAALRDDEHGLLGRLHRAGELGGPESPGGNRQVEAELGLVFAGRHPGRRDPADIVVVARAGLAIEDVTLAAAIYQSASRLGLGIDIPTHSWEAINE
jgi:ornithine cyclodeaminase/alanine dehydrogenase-like protein (mu-crystallin family)